MNSSLLCSILRTDRVEIKNKAKFVSNVQFELLTNTTLCRKFAFRSRNEVDSVVKSASNCSLFRWHGYFHSFDCHYWRGIKVCSMRNRKFLPFTNTFPYALLLSWARYSLICLAYSFLRIKHYSSVLPEDCRVITISEGRLTIRHARPASKSPAPAT